MVVVFQTRFPKTHAVSRISTYYYLGTSFPLKKTGWLKANVGHMGLYRVNYDHENWELLGDQLTHNHRVSRGQVEVALLRLSTTHANILKQVVFALLVPSCQQVWNNVLTIVTTLLILSELLQGCSNKSDTVMI